MDQPVVAFLLRQCFEPGKDNGRTLMKISNIFTAVCTSVAKAADEALNLRLEELTEKLKFEQGINYSDAFEAAFVWSGFNPAGCRWHKTHPTQARPGQSRLERPEWGR
jgi:hypothetical protein